MKFLKMFISKIHSYINFLLLSYLQNILLKIKFIKNKIVQKIQNDIKTKQFLTSN